MNQKMLKKAVYKMRFPYTSISRVYTKMGDEGKTHLRGGREVSKDSMRIEACGTVDELNAFVGMLKESVIKIRSQFPKEIGQFLQVLRRIQRELFDLGSLLASMPEDASKQSLQITEKEIQQLEEEIDYSSQKLPGLHSFVIPGGSRCSADLNICRTVCRRAERTLVHLAQKERVPGTVLKYINRLGDAFFVWSRWINNLLNVNEKLWD
ncbi:MAG: cob(I)yrinic acid a,c-diamide adenosyltransferase [Desulfobacteraceae bacterium]|nr:cob(I)yrinic acid a,c-diamide adenosyltransferase [Desulfobacteraceae bacterium]